MVTTTPRQPQAPTQVLTDAEVEALTARLTEPSPLAARARAFVARHPVLVRRTRRVWAVWLWASLVLTVLGALLVPALRDGFWAVLWCFFILIQMFLLARTKTLSWRVVTGVFTASFLVLSPLLGLAGWLVASLLSWDTSDAASGVLIAGPVEEAGKLLPLLLVVWLARRRAERLSACDFLMLGAAAGLAFQAFEDGLRRLATNSFAAEIVGVTGGLPQYGFGLLPGWSMKFGGELILGNYVTFPGHYVTTAIVAAGIGLALRARHAPRARWVACLALFVMVVVDHAIFNWPSASSRNDLPTSLVVPDLLRILHRLWGGGGLAQALLLVLLGLCLIADVRHTRAVDSLLPPLPRVRLIAWADRMAAKVPLAAVRWLVWTLISVVHELAVVARVLFSGRPDPRATDERALPLGHRLALALAGLRRRRELAQGLSGSLHRLHRRGGRRRARYVPALAALAVPLLVAGLLTAAAGQPGHDPGLLAGGYLANLLDDLADWWGELGFAGQVLATAAIAALLALTGGVGFLPALGWATSATWVADHGRDIAAFLRNPEQATIDFVDNLTPGRTAGYGLEFTLGRLIPAGAGALAGRELGDLYRLGRRDLGALREELRDGLRGLHYDERGSILLPGGGLDLDKIHRTSRSNKHILQGEGYGNGGHRPGTGFPGKSEFPDGWTDQQILDTVDQAARNKVREPGSRVTPGGKIQWYYEGEANGVRVGIVVDDQQGRMVSGFPLEGQPGTFTNPPKPATPPLFMAKDQPTYTRPDPQTGRPGYFTYRGVDGNPVYTDESGRLLRLPATWGTE